MALDIEVVRRVAALAHLELTPHEETVLAEELAHVLDYIEMLRAVPTEGVPATTHPVHLETVLAADVVRAGLPREDVLRAPADADAENGLFRVPRVV
jgi:aspartyl-tRNA(Asn)/glutamyl-tRNA(Gln) amidotransferase subunit C